MPSENGRIWFFICIHLRLFVFWLLGDGTIYSILWILKVFQTFYA